MITADLYDEGDDRFIGAQGTYNDKDRFIQVPGSRYHANTRTWRFPLTWAVCLQLRSLFGQDLRIGPELQNWAWAEREQLELVNTVRESLDLPSGSHYFDIIGKCIDTIEATSELTLKPFQRAGVGYLVTAERAGLFDPMGTGKGPQAIRAIQVMREINLHYTDDPIDIFPVLVVCPNSLKNTVWANEFARWAPELHVQVVDGAASMRRKQILSVHNDEDAPDVIVMNWESVRLHSRLAPYGTIKLTDAQKEPKELNTVGFPTVIMDEAHRLASIGSQKKSVEVEREDGTMTTVKTTVPTSQQALACWQLAHDARNVFILTGTPINESVEDFFGILHAIRPAWFPAKTKYIDRYGQKTFGLWGGIEVLGLKPENEQEFRAITTPLYRRIPKDLALPQLPPKLPTQYRETPMSPKQATAYREMEASYMAMVDDQLVVAESSVEMFSRLVQFASASTEIVGYKEKPNGGKKPVVRLSAPSTKIDDLVELLAELGNEPLAVTAVSRQLIELTAARLDKEKISYGLVTGAQSAYDCAQAVENFQKGRLRVILYTLGAGAEGLTLTRTNHLLFMQRSWSPRQNNQGEDRIHRIGSEIHDSIHIIEQITPGTIEERRIDTLKGKEERIEEIIQDRAVLRRLLGGDA